MLYEVFLKSPNLVRPSIFHDTARRDNQVRVSLQ